MTSPKRPFSAARERRRSYDDSDNPRRTFLHVRAGQGPREMKPHPLHTCSWTLFQMSRCIWQHLETEALSTLRSEWNIYVLKIWGDKSEMLKAGKHWLYFSGLLDVVQANVSATLLAALGLSPPWFELSSWPSAENHRGGNQSLTLAKAKCSPQFHQHLWSIIMCRSPYAVLGLQYDPTLSEKKKRCIFSCIWQKLCCIMEGLDPVVIMNVKERLPAFSKNEVCINFAELLTPISSIQ